MCVEHFPSYQDFLTCTGDSKIQSVPRGLPDNLGELAKMCKMEMQCTLIIHVCFTHSCPLRTHVAGFCLQVFPWDTQGNLPGFHISLAAHFKRIGEVKFVRLHVHTTCMPC